MMPIDIVRFVSAAANIPGQPAQISILCPDPRVIAPAKGAIQIGADSGMQSRFRKLANVID